MSQQQLLMRDSTTVGKMPNVYGNPEMLIADLMDDIYGSRATTNILSLHSSINNNNNEPMLSQLNTATLSRSSSKRQALNPPKIFSNRAPPIHSSLGISYALEDAQQKNTYYNDFIQAPATTTGSVVVEGSISNCSSPPLINSSEESPRAFTTMVNSLTNQQIKKNSDSENFNNQITLFNINNNINKKIQTYSSEDCTLTTTTNSSVSFIIFKYATNLCILISLDCC